MKKFFVFVLLIVAGYFIYDNFLKEVPPYQLTDAYSKQREGVSIEAPTCLLYTSPSPRDRTISYAVFCLKKKNHRFTVLHLMIYM